MKVSLVQNNKKGIQQNCSQRQVLPRPKDLVVNPSFKHLPKQGSLRAKFLLAFHDNVSSERKGRFTQAFIKNKGNGSRKQDPIAWFKREHVQFLVYLEGAFYLFLNKFNLKIHSNKCLGSKS